MGCGWHICKGIHICNNDTICSELEWFVNHAHAFNGIFPLRTVAWDPPTQLADTTIYLADACLRGVVFWYPELWLDYQCHVPKSHTAPIFHWEAVAVVCAMIAPLVSWSLCLVVYTDNQNTVDIWYSLKRSAPCNTTLMLTINSLICHNVNAHMLHILDIDN